MAIGDLFGLVLGFDLSCGCLICWFIVLVIGICGLIAVWLCVCWLECLMTLGVWVGGGFRLGLMVGVLAGGFVWGGYFLVWALLCFCLRCAL